MNYKRKIFVEQNGNIHQYELNRTERNLLQELENDGLLAKNIQLIYEKSPEDGVQITKIYTNIEMKTCIGLSDGKRLEILDINDTYIEPILSFEEMEKLPPLDVNSIEAFAVNSNQFYIVDKFDNKRYFKINVKRDYICLNLKYGDKWLSQECVWFKEGAS